MSDDPLRARLRRALLAAMKGRDPVAIAALRSGLAAIDNAEAVAPPPAPMPRAGIVAAGMVGLGAGEAERRQLSEDQMADIIRTEIADRQAAAEEYERAGHLDQSARLTAEADVLAAHLTRS